MIWNASDQANAERLVDQAGTLNCNLGQRGGWIAGCPDPAYALSAGNQSKGGVFGSGRDSQDTFVACFHPTQDPICSCDGSAHSMGTGSRGGCSSHAVAIPINADADRSNSAALTPSPDAEGRIRLRDPGIGIGENGDPMFTMQSTKPHAVAIDLQNVAMGGDICGTLDTTRPSRGGGQAVAFKPSHFTRGKDGAPAEVVSPLSADADKGDQDTVVAFAQNQLGEVRVNADVMGTVNQNQNASGRNTPMVFANRTRDGIKVPEVMKDGVVPALTNPGGGGRSDAVNVAAAMQVRRLCPSECEALQGFPIGYTDVTYRKKPAADGPRYRALGNSMAVPCMHWLGKRIHEATQCD